MSTQSTRFDRFCSRLWLVLAIGGAILAVILFTAGAATAATDAFGSRAWSNARLTTNMKLANAQISLHDRILNRQATLVRSAREDARSALWIANDAYDSSASWTRTLIECMMLRDRLERACLEDAVASEQLP